MPCGFDVLESRELPSTACTILLIFSIHLPVCAGPWSSVNMPLALNTRTMKFHSAENVLYPARGGWLHSPSMYIIGISLGSFWKHCKPAFRVHLWKISVDSKPHSALQYVIKGTEIMRSSHMALVLLCHIPLSRKLTEVFCRLSVTWQTFLWLPSEPETFRTL